MKKSLVGRKREREILVEALQSDEPEMVAVIGRRRVGKTFLVKQVYEEHILFEVTGLQDGDLKKQLANFSFALSRHSGSRIPLKTPADWLEAFQMLVLHLSQISDDAKKVVFFDEVPWMATKKSDFLTGLGFFWNSWAVNRNIVVVICGSAASWMIEKVVNNRGGLHNRITKRIFLEPFNLAETESYLNSRNIHFNRYQIVELYMALGGIPHYLKEVKAGKSAVQNIDTICFSKEGLLRDEFSRLYPALFANAEKHIAIIRALATSRQGLTRQKTLQLSDLPEGGNTTKVLQELEQSGFISSYFPFGKKKKGKLYRLTDEYSLFYLQFMEDKSHEGSQTWHHLSQTQAYKTWSGYAFENICLKHIPQVKKALGIAGVYSKSSSFVKKGTEEEKGIQIDLLIDRNDKVINLVEIKYYNAELSLSAEYAQALREKIRIFQEATNTRKHIMLTLITAFGLKANKHSLGLIDQVLGLDDLFEG
ncbi:MAG: AAA family ATPase [Phaeodactylibacter sp.]|nr:AAA family ATPase [Phaeodactylibacter sp.]MCB9297717.1 AAA family ATPase [Lewinellaceae bacterium]